jgi:hypothetical protein
MATTTLEIIVKLIADNVNPRLMNAIESRHFRAEVTLSRRVKARLDKSQGSTACQVP